MKRKRSRIKPGDFDGRTHAGRWVKAATAELTTEVGQGRPESVSYPQRILIRMATKLKYHLKTMWEDLERRQDAVYREDASARRELRAILRDLAPDGDRLTRRRWVDAQLQLEAIR